MNVSLAEDLTRCVWVLLKTFHVLLRTSDDACEFCWRPLAMRLNFAEDLWRCMWILLRTFDDACEFCWGLLSLVISFVRQSSIPDDDASFFRAYQKIMLQNMFWNKNHVRDVFRRSKCTREAWCLLDEAHVFPKAKIRGSEKHLERFVFFMFSYRFMLKTNWIMLKRRFYVKIS